MLFLYRPRQTWIPYARPREAMRQDAYNQRTQQEFAATRRVAPVGATPDAPAGSTAESNAGKLGKLAQLHESGVLTDEEYTVAKARLSGSEDQPA
jgi:hypothetical protein